MTDKLTLFQFFDVNKHWITLNINSISVVYYNKIYLDDGTYIRITDEVKENLFDWLMKNGEIYRFDEQSRVFCKLEDNNDR